MTDGRTIRVTDARDCVFANLLERWASEQPDKVFARFFRGPEWTYDETFRSARRTANALAGLGVVQGDLVLCWLPNGPDMLRVWLGLNLLGAVFVPVNTSYRGASLEHVLRLAGARLLIGHELLLDRLRDVERGSLAGVVSIGEAGPLPIDGLQVHPRSVLDGGDDSVVVTPRPIEAWDTQSVIFTSGTTGPSKAVLSSYAHLHAQSAEAFAPFTRDDCYLLFAPMFHCGGTIPVGIALAKGGSIGVIDSFHPDTFWEAIDSMGCTWSYVVLAMPRLLMKQPPSPDDRRHALRNIIVSGDTRAFCERYGVRGYAAFNMSEICTPTFTEHSLDAPGLAMSCGRMRPGIEARIVDEHDNELPRGQVGELILRTERPYMFSHGYLNNVEATARAWRNGWFHTGDLMRVDADGNFFFVDRLKDMIRRRGENISSYEVEAATVRFPAVREAAAVPIRDETGDEEVMVAVLLDPDQPYATEALLEHLVGALPHFAVPRYVRVVADFPRTPTGKILKSGLAAEGVTADTWDRERHGIVLRRQALA